MNKEEKKFEDAVTELFSEINGKIMDYRTCKLFENGMLELVRHLNETWENKVKEMGKFMCDDCKDRIKDKLGRKSEC